MEEINNLLNCNNLKIVQNTDWFKFSIDSVLLSNFVKVNNKMNIVDFCTGNAPIPLFLSTRTKSKITGIELQDKIYNMAVKSIKINDLSNQISIINCDVKKFAKDSETDVYDLITCNPPYFKYKSTNDINNNSIKALARHEISLSLDDIFCAAKKILKNNGKIALIHRTDRLIDIIVSMKKHNIEPKRISFIYPYNNSKSNMVLIEGSKNGKAGLTVEKETVVHNKDGSYTDVVNTMFNGG